MQKKKAVLLLSSGLDSAANLVLCPSKLDIEIPVALTIDYGQKGALQEIAHAAKLAKRFGVEHVVFDFKNFSALINSKSALMDYGQTMPSPVDLDKMSVITESAKAVWVPNRNAVMLSIAAAMAESRCLDAIVVGFNAEEAVTFPDNSLDFMTAITSAFCFSTANQIEVVSATVGLNKKEIVSEIAVMNFPFEYIWSCYLGGVGEGASFHCGECESCKRLKRALVVGLDEKKSKAVIEKIF